MVQDFGNGLLGFIVVIGFLIFIHEAGHFIFAKLFGVRVLVFSFGFGKRLLGFHKGDTDYRLSLIPLGGYVRMAGDNAEENVAGAPDEFLSKPRWQRFLILFAGPMMNLLVAIFFVAGLAMAGREEIETKPVIASVEANKPAQRAGLQPGDVIVRIKGEPVKDFEDVRLIVGMNAGTPVRLDYLRNGKSGTTMLTPERVDGSFGPIGRAGIGGAGMEPVVARVEPGSPAAAAGIRAGDRIVKANGQPVTALEHYLKVSNDMKTQPVTVELLRGAERLTVQVAPSSDRKLALYRGLFPRTTYFQLSFVQALKYSVAFNWKMLRITFSAIGRLFRPEGSVKELSGPINIARISGDALRGGLVETLGLMAMISLQLGVMNLLPIPVLDGGHIMILLLESVARREFSLRVKERIQQVGFALLATLMIVVLYNDVISNVLRFKKG
jgi:regulator of sigma E protease